MNSSVHPDTKMSEKTSNDADENGHVPKERKGTGQSKETPKPAKDLRFGWFSIKPNWIQFMNAAAIYASLLSMVNVFLSGTSNGLAGAVQSSIERRFQLSSAQGSTIAVAYEILGIPISVFITYLGTVGCHRPHWAAGGILSGCLGCFVYALPHFTTGVYMPGGSGGDNSGDEYMCRNRTGEDICSEDDGGENPDDLANYIWVFIAARLLLAFGGGCVYTLGITFLDDCVTKEKFSFWSSIFAAGGTIGM